jgi:hypothetical protein
MKKLFLPFFLIFISHSFSQQLPDSQLRINPSLEYSFNKKWATSFDYMYCLEDNFNQFQGSIIQLGVDYSVNKKLKFGFAYRFTTSFIDDNHRFFVNAQYKMKFNRISIASALRYEYQTDNFDPEYMQFYNPPTHTFRKRVTFEYNVPNSKLSFSFAPELFLRLDQVGLEYNRFRYDIGCKYNLPKGQRVGLTVFFDDYGSTKKTDRFVWVTNYNIDLNGLFKKSKKLKKPKNPLN